MSFFNPTELQGTKVVQHRLPQCGRCGLYKLCNSPKMPPTGEGKRRILFVAEAPGETEDARGEQLVGKSGQYLRTVLAKLDCDLDECIKTNAVICHPPGNKITDVHVSSCRPNLLKTIREKKPHVIVLLGGSSINSLMPDARDDPVGPIGRWVGWKIPSFVHGAWLCPTYHPSYLLREENPTLSRLFRGHLAEALALEEVPIPGEDLEALKGQVERIVSPREARLRLRDLSRVEEGHLAFDYESTGLKPDRPGHKIVACSFCLDGKGTFSFLVQEEHHKLMRKILRGPTGKIASNLKNEERWSVAILGTRVRRWYWDTMLAAHYIDNRPGITGLKFQSFVSFGIANYDGVVSQFFQDCDAQGFNKVHDIPVEDLLLYNALDSLLEYKLTLVQRKALGLST